MDYIDFCKHENLIRQNWFSKTYTAKVSIGGTSLMPCHMTHISIPLPEDMEAIAARMFRLNKEDLPSFYDWLWERVKTNVSALRFLNRGQMAGLTTLYSADVVKNEDTRHIYMITPEYQKYIDTVSGKDMDLSTMLGAGIRISNLIRDLAAAGYAHGNICMEALYVDGDGKIVLGDLYYATPIKQAKENNPYRYDIPPHVSEHSLATGERDQGTDLFSLCSLLWNLIAGYPADVRLPYRMIPTSSLEAYTNLLKFGMTATGETADQVLTSFRKQISDLKRATAKGDTSNIAVPVSAYIAPRFAARRKTVQLTEKDVLNALSGLAEG